MTVPLRSGRTTRESTGQPGALCDGRALSRCTPRADRSIAHIWEFVQSGGGAVYFLSSAERIACKDTPYSPRRMQQVVQASTALASIDKLGLSASPPALRGHDAVRTGMPLEQM